MQPKPRTKHSISDDYSLDPKSEVSTPSTGISSNTESAGTSPNSKPHDSTQTLKLDNHEIKGKVDSNIALSGSNAESSQPLSVMDTDPVIVLKEYTSGTVSPEAKRHHSVATSLSRNSAVSRKTINRLQYEKFYNFLANSRESDALVYSLTRKEAWIQYNGPRQSDKRTLEIVELWTMMALRYLLQNRLIYSPPALKCLQNFKSRTKLREQSGNGSTILDIQGLFKDHWGWQLALDFQQATVYGVRIDPQQTFPDSDLNYEGPPNYIPCVAHSIGSLPFDDDFFDVVCARTLWYLIRSDQWNSAFKEIMRVLKPGGVLELVNSDYDVINGNPDEDGRWWARLKKACLLAHIDPNPSATAARKLIDTGFLDINRAMIALPREWGGQIGNLTDFLFLYYFDSLYQAFGLMDPSEVEEFRRGSKAARIKGYCSCGNITLFYCTKPLKENNC